MQCNRQIGAYAGKALASKEEGEEIGLRILFRTGGREQSMYWRNRKEDWFIDPTKVLFGSVVGTSSQNLSRSHVRVKYRHEAAARFVPLATFARRCHELIRGGSALDIEQLLVAPIVKQRHAEFFDGLTDWGPAMRRAWSARGQV